MIQRTVAHAIVPSLGMRIPITPAALPSALQRMSRTVVASGGTIGGPKATSPKPVKGCHGRKSNRAPHPSVLPTWRPERKNSVTSLALARSETCTRGSGEFTSRTSTTRHELDTVPPIPTSFPPFPPFRTRRRCWNFKICSTTPSHS